MQHANTDYMVKCVKWLLYARFHVLKPWNRTLRILRDAWSYNFTHTVQKGILFGKINKKGNLEHFYFSIP